MITLDQIKLLETKVQTAVDKISMLSRENSTLKGKLEEYQQRIGELEVLINQFKTDQSRIEEGILNALSQLDNLEDSVDRMDINNDEPEEDFVETESGMEEVESTFSVSSTGNDSETSAPLPSDDEVLEEDDDLYQELEEEAGTPTASELSEEETVESGEAELDIF